MWGVVGPCGCAVWCCLVCGGRAVLVCPYVHLPSQTQFGSLDVESSAQHDAYLERMKAEAEDRDSEDGEEEQASLLCTACLPVCGCWYSEVLCVVCCLCTEDSDFVAGDSSEDDLE